jgi:hypothetical protein
MQYKTCEYCQSHLDPGETCDCREAQKERGRTKEKKGREKKHKKKSRQ